MFVRKIFCFAVLAVLFLIGCEVGEVITPGEEVVVNEWVDPVDIGGEYSVSVEDIEFDRYYALDTGGQVIFEEGKEGDGVLVSDDGSLHAFLTTPVVDDVGNPVVIDGHPRFEQKMVGTIVPEGPPIVSLLIFSVHTDDGKELITQKNNLQEHHFTPYVEIDRVLDYNLPILIEIQLEERSELGGKVTKHRILFVVPKGYTSALGLAGYAFFVHDSTHGRSSASILPYTEMENIELPAKIGLPGSFGDIDLPLEDKVVPVGHTFRPYRIRSSSFVVGDMRVEGSW